MSKTNFTKGEWIVENKEHNLYSMIYSESGKRIAEVKSYGKSDSFKDPSVKERIANAKLISTSPELLSALNDLLIYCRLNSTSQLEPLIRKAENAVKKATS